ncbi:MAG: 3-isopropylmalate dehydrogenase [Alphaproteobacteria bacterium]|nr:3-isopropylmalate dehydrogenase [Alphaproteobacteria bacterium]
MKVLVLDGDGIGPEVNAQALAVLSVAADAAGLSLEVERALFGGASLDAHGLPVTDAVIADAKAADAVLLGAVGGPKWDDVAPHLRAERGLLRLRKELEVYANLRPARFSSALSAASPLRPERATGADFVIVRELVGGIYFGEPRGIDREAADPVGFNTMVYTRSGIERVARVAFELARQRGKRLTSVDKANVLEVTRYWREVVTELGATEYPDVALDHAYVDSYAMKMVANPRDADVVVTGNMFGDILSDLAAALTGSLGMLPSASIGAGGAVYEPVHGSAPDIAGQGKANPLGAILSVGMLLQHTAGRSDLKAAVDGAVQAALDDGLRTGDIAWGEPGTRQVGTVEIGQAVVDHLRSALEAGTVPLSA